MHTPTFPRSETNGELANLQSTRYQQIRCPLSLTSHILFPTLHEFYAKSLLGIVVAIFVAQARQALKGDIQVCHIPHHFSIRQRKSIPPLGFVSPYNLLLQSSSHMACERVPLRLCWRGGELVMDRDPSACRKWSYFPMSYSSPAGHFFSSNDFFLFSKSAFITRGMYVHTDTPTGCGYNLVGWNTE